MIAELNKDEIIKYCEIHSNKESDLASELIKYTYDNEPAPQMISGIQVANILQSLIIASNAKKILEIGMFTGYSALKMSECITSDAVIHTCELGENHIKTAKKFLKKSNRYNQIKIHGGPALKSIKVFEENSFDFCFIDADKNNYTNYYKECIKLLRPNGIMVLDNMLWGGKILNPRDKETKTIAETAKVINNDQTCFNTMLPIRDGLMLCIKK